MIESSRTSSARNLFLLILIFLIATDLAVFFDIPFLRQTLGFLFITILPGLVILQVLRLNKLSTIETILYSVGLSVAFSMFVGLLVNSLYPFFGISQPLSTMPLIITLSIIILPLSIIGYLRSKDFPSSASINIKELFSPWVLFLLLLPIISVLGATLFSFYGNNVVLLLLIGLISLAVILATFDIIPAKFFPWTIVMIALALLLHRALVPFEFLPSGDVMWEYYAYKTVEINSYWDPAISGNLNAMLSVTIQPTIYSELLNIDGAWVFKIIYPLIFALVPLTLYKVYQKQTTEKVAFLSTFFFMSVFAFFYTLPVIGRQQIAELFYVLVIMLLLSKEMNSLHRAALLIIFGASLVVSHYALSYIFMLQMFVALLILHTIMKKPTTNGLSENLRNVTPKKSITLSGTFAMLFLVLALAWYIYVSGSSTFSTIVTSGEHMYNSLTDFFSLSGREPEVLGAIGLTPITSWLSYIFRPLQYATQLFIIVGLVRLVIKYKEMRFAREYMAMLLFSLGLILATIVVPTFSQQLNTERTYHIALILAAPLCILGGETVFKYMFKPLRRISSSPSACAKILLLILIPYFLFNTGFVHILVGEKTGSLLGLQQYKTGNDEEKAMFYLKWIQREDVSGARWLAENSVDNPTVYAGWSSKHYLLSPYALIPFKKTRLLGNQTHIEKDSFVFLRYYNIKENRILTDYTAGEMVIGKTTEISQIVEMNKIYSNGGSEVYR